MLLENQRNDAAGEIIVEHGDKTGQLGNGGALGQHLFYQAVNILTQRYQLFDTLRAGDGLTKGGYSHPLQ